MSDPRKTAFTVTVVNHTGGVGKATVAANIGASCISQTDIDGLSIILGDAEMGAALVELAAGWRSDLALDEAIRGLRDGDLFDSKLAPALLPWPKNIGYKQTTDVYLIKLAEESGATLTLDLRLKRAFLNRDVEAITLA